jgi:hypothetical protein
MSHSAAQIRLLEIMKTIMGKLDCFLASNDPFPLGVIELDTIAEYLGGMGLKPDGNRLLREHKFILEQGFALLESERWASDPEGAGRLGLSPKFADEPEEVRNTRRIAVRGTAQRMLDRLCKIVQIVTDDAPGLVQDAEQLAQQDSISMEGKPKAQKQSTQRGDARIKIIAALTKHHEYAEGGCLNPRPVGNNELARLASVSESTVSTFFKVKFHGHSKYRAVCRETGLLTAALKLLNEEFAPHNLYGGCPARERERDDQGDE